MRALVLFGGLSLVALFVGLDRLDWMDDREARDAAVAREVLWYREPLSPRLGGAVWLEKPLLAYVPEVLLARLAPDSPVPSRALRAALAVALIATTAGIGARWLGRSAGVMGGAILATSLAIPVAARTDGTQLLVSLLGWLGWSGLVAARLGTGRPRGLGAAYAALASACVLGGPFAALWPIAAVWLGGPGGAGTRRRMGLPWGLAIVAGLSLPWYGAMLERHGTPFALAMLAFPYGGPPLHPWYAALARALGFLVAGFFPWSPLLTAALLPRRAEVASPAKPATDLTRLLVVTLVWASVPILFAPAAPLPAVLPALPAAALLAGALIERAFAGDPLAGRALSQASWLVAGSGTVASAMLVLVSRRLGDAAPEIRLLGAFLLLASWAPALASFMGRTRAAPALLACMVAFGSPLVAWRTLPALAGFLSTGPVAAAMNQASPPDAPLLVVESPPPSLRLRLARRLVRPEQLRAALRRERGSDGRVYVAFPPRRESEVARAAAPEALEILQRTPALVLVRVGAP